MCFEHIIIEWKHGERYVGPFVCVKVDGNVVLLIGSVDVCSVQNPLQLSWQSVRLLTVRSQVRTLLEETYFLFLAIPLSFYGPLKIFNESLGNVPSFISFLFHFGPEANQNSVFSFSYDQRISNYTFLTSAGSPRLLKHRDNHCSVHLQKVNFQTFVDHACLRTTSRDLQEAPQSIKETTEKNFNLGSVSPRRPWSRAWP